MFSPPKVNPFEENFMQRFILENTLSPMYVGEDHMDLQMGKSQSLLCDEDNLSPFQVARQVPLQRFNSEVFHDFSEVMRPRMGDGNKFLKSAATSPHMQNSGSDYEILHLIGRGSLGRVFKVKSRIDGLFYAAKQVPRDTNLECLTHRNLVQFNGCWQHEDQLYIIMEHCEYSLKQKMHSRLYESEIRQVLQDVCTSLSNLPTAHLHLHGGNILMSKQMKYKVGDYGISKSDTHHKAPEIDKNKMSDIYSLGWVLLELMLEKEISNISSQVLSKMDNLSYYSTSLKQQIRKMLSMNPNDRPDTQQLVRKVDNDQELQYLRAENNELQCQIQQLSGTNSVRRNSQ